MIFIMDLSYQTVELLYLHNFNIAIYKISLKDFANTQNIWYVAESPSDLTVLPPTPLDFSQNKVMLVS